ncbi:MAG: carboxypeptidase regulatory-like domain-containing protein [Acidobacteriales bacterium]|nr:carboxypeptidase regulatory-like domain-containing protein [Terriglobales bacterium]
MKQRLVAIIAAAAMLATVHPAMAQFGRKQQQPQIRHVTGKVLSANDAPVKDAVVYLKNLKTLAIKTLISDAQGNYNFMELSPNVDYQIWAESNGQKSSTKTVSSFDSRSEFDVDLHLK